MDTAAESIRVLTWNIWWKFGEWEQRQAALLSVLRDVAPDIVCLQEVFPADGDEPDQAQQMASALGFRHATSFDESRPWMGNAILSRWPIDDVEAQLLPGPPGKRALRSALHATVAGPCEIPVTSTHFSWEYDESATRLAQARALARRVGERRDRGPHGFPPVVCGDLNATPDTDELRLLTGRSPVARRGMVLVDSWAAVHDSLGATWHRDNPNLSHTSWPQRRLDYILVAWPRTKPAGTVIDCQIVGDQPVDGVVASDHYAVMADLLLG